MTIIIFVKSKMFILYMSCLFNSLSYFIPESSHDIRQKICDYLQENKPIIQDLDTQFILSFEKPNYIENMRLHHEWGGAIEIQSACNIWNLKITVKNYRNNDKIGNNVGNNTNIEFIPVTYSTNIDYKKIELEWTGGHYEPVKNM